MYLNAALQFLLVQNNAYPFVLGTGDWGNSSCVQKKKKNIKKEKGIKYCLGRGVRPHDKAASRMMEE